MSKNKVIRANIKIKLMLILERLNILSLKNNHDMLELALTMTNLEEEGYDEA